MINLNSLPTDDVRQHYPQKILSVDEASLKRFSCKNFQRFDGGESSQGVASVANPFVVRTALHCLDLARLAPSGFNTQPYRLILVHSPEQKQKLSRFCLGPNAARVQDSDCTVVFLADRKYLWNLPRYSTWIRQLRKTTSKSVPGSEDDVTSETRNRREEKMMRKILFYIAIFSSSYPLPRIVAAPLSFMVRTAVGFLGFFTQRFYPLPSLSSAETWSSKMVMLVAMTYMLACSSRGIATIPMEGIYAPGIRRVLNIPSRYAIPVVVSTGYPAFRVEKPLKIGAQDRRFPRKEVIYEDSFGEDLKFLPES